MRLSSTVDNIVAAWSAGTRNSMESTQESGFYCCESYIECGRASVTK